MTEQEKLWAKRRAKAAKLSGPKPVELPSHSWRCQVMVDGRRISVVDDDPEVAHAKALAIKTGTVSYTHLDVYKRQALVRPCRPAAA